MEYNIVMIKRHLLEKIAEISKEWKAIMLYGPRQIGKTTILNEIIFKYYNHFKIFDFSNVTLRESVKADAKSFFELHRGKLFLDEVQKAPIIFDFLKSLIDSQETRPQFFLSGSESIELIHGTNESLAGRIGLIQMQTLSNSEIYETDNFVFKSDLNLLAKRRQPPLSLLKTFEKIILGSMPEIVCGKKNNSNIFYSSYLKSVLKKDIKEDLLNISNDELFMKFLTILATQVGSQINYSKIGAIINVDTKTIIAWVNCLKSIGLIFVLEPFSHNIFNKTTKAPKLYFYDTGLVCYLTKYKDAKTLMESDFSGHIFECLVISEIMKGFINNLEISSVSYIQDTNNKNKEIDLIIEGDNGVIYPIEIKKSSTVHSTYFDNYDILKKHNYNLGPITVICTTDDIYSFGKDKIALP
jgi:predicted AAA+ superfamily ATPase